MAFSVEYDAATDIITINYSQKITIAEIAKGAGEAAQFAEKQKTTRILIDVVHCDLALSAVDLYVLPREIAKRMSELGIDIRKFKRALVAPQGNTEELQFMETSLFYGGQSVRIFRDIDEAKQWLLGPV